MQLLQYCVAMASRQLLVSLTDACGSTYNAARVLPDAGDVSARLCDAIAAVHIVEFIYLTAIID